jgi:tripeptide aminopeptidase
MNPPIESALDRFGRYAALDTQSAEGRGAVPSTAGQWTLARLLVTELGELGAQEIHLDEHCIVYAKVPANLAHDGRVPVVGFIAHLDTSPAAPGDHVRVVIHPNYAGGDIVLPGEPSRIIRAADNPELGELIGDDIVTGDGTTLLGSDDKAGIAEILTMVDTLAQNPDLRHGAIAIAFTPDEEITEGIQFFDLARFGATFAYTVDGEALGEINNETWNARTATVTFTGVSTHPGWAKGIMVNAIDALADFVTRFPPDQRPETTDGRDGFMHPLSGTLDVGVASLTIWLRDFERQGLDAQEQTLRAMIEATRAGFPRVTIDLAVEDRYANMYEVLRHHPSLIDNAAEATRRAGLRPVIKPVRGGTDGASLTFRGLPTPHLFTGGHNAHGMLEFNSRGGLEKTTETLVHLVQLIADGAPARDPGHLPGGRRPG